MMPTVDTEELLAKPLDTIESLRADLEAAAHDDSDDGVENQKASSALARAVSEALLAGPTPALSRVPVLSRKAFGEGKLPPNSLVRYRGMIQDQYEPEYFVGSFDQVEISTGQRSRVNVKYADSIPDRQGFVNTFDEAGAETMERLPLFCVPVPGQSPWTHTLEGSVESTGAAERNPPQGLPKRQREMGVDTMDCTDDNDATLNSHLGNGQRKNPRATGSANTTEQNGLASSTSTTVTASTAAFEHRQELELDGLPCLVKVYDFRKGLLKLNDTVEFVGILAYDPPVPSPGDHSSTVAATAEERQGTASIGVSDLYRGLDDFSRKVPPASLAPRLHCIFHRKLPACSPLEVDARDPRAALYAVQGPLPFGTFMQEMKRQAIEHLAKALAGDVLAAEYTLLTLLSRAYVRTEALAPGSLSLNLHGVPAESAIGFHAAVAELVPKCVRLPVTTESLSAKFKFAPKKDYEADRLMLSNLQLSDGTVIILDEMVLEPGQIGTEGLGNLAVLNSLLSRQKVPYDFGFYKMDFDVDHPSISLSYGRSVVPTIASLPVVPRNGCGAAGDGWSTVVNTTEDITAGGVTDKAALTRLRVYVEATRRMELTLDKDSSGMAEEDFVKARQEGQTITGDDFHRWLTVARLTALSLGDSSLSVSHWNHMKELEAQMAARMKAEKNNQTGNEANRATISPNKATPLHAIPQM